MAGKSTIWDLALEITGDDKGATAALRQVKKNMEDVQKAGKQLGADFKNFTQNASRLALGVVGGVTAAAAGVMSMANSFADAGDKVLTAAAATGIGVEAYQELQYALGQSGVSAETFDSALQKFNLTVRQGAAGNAAAARQLEEVGLSAEKLSKLAPEEAMMRLSDYMQQLPNDAERTRVAVQLFGKTAGPEMMVALKEGSTALANLREESKTATFTFSKDQAELSRQFQNTKKGLMGAFENVKFSFIAGSMGPVTEALKTLQETVLSSVPSISELGERFGKWLGDMVKRLPEIIAKIKEFGAWIKNTVTKVIDFVGGFKNLLKILAGLAIAPTFISGLKVVWSLGKFIKITMAAIGPILSGLATGGFGALASAALPIIGIIAGIAAAIAGVVLIVKNWEKITAWIKEHKEVLTLVGIAVGTLTAAIIAYNVAQAITNAGGIVAVARMGAHAIATGVLTGVTTVATVATTAFGAAMAFLTSPITLVVLAIGAVIAIIYLLVKNWDKVKEVAGKVWDAICGFVGKAVDFIKNIFGSVGNFFGGVWNGVKNVAGKAWEGIKGAASNGWENIKNGATKAGGFLKNNWKTIAIGMVNPWAGGLKALYDHNEKFRNFVDNTWGKIKNITGAVWDKMPDGVKDIFIKIKDIITGAIENIKSIIGLFTDFFKNVFTDPIGAVKNLFFGLVDVFTGIFNSIKEKIQSFVSFFTDKFKVVGDVIGSVGNFFGGAVNGVKNFVGGLFGHAEGGIFTTRHIAEICEKGPEAVVPLNKSPQGFDIWKQAGELGGYMERMAKTATGTSGVSRTETPPIMQAAAQRISGGENIINVEFTQNNTFTGGTPDKETINQISAAGGQAADELKEKFETLMDEFLRNKRRVSYA